MRRINYIRLGVAVMIALMASFYFCSKNIKPPVSAIETEDQQSSQLMKSRWKIVLFEGGYKTDDFRNFEFAFGSNATVTGTHGADKYKGTWTIGTDKQQRRRLYINFGNQAPLDGLDKNWFVSELSDNRLRLEFSIGAEPSGPVSDANADNATDRPMLQKAYFETVTTNNASPTDNNPN